MKHNKALVTSPPSSLKIMNKPSNSRPKRWCHVEMRSLEGHVQCYKCNDEREGCINDAQGDGPLMSMYVIMWCSKVALGSSTSLMGLLMKHKLVDCSKWGLRRWCMSSHVSRVRQTSSGPRINCQTMCALLNQLRVLLVQVHHLVNNVGRRTSYERC